VVLVPGFPITPSTKWLETMSAKISSGSVGLKKVKLLESEHTVADYMAGAASACRDLLVTTATSSVGLDHMTETTRSLGASGLGNIMLVNVYRATANYPLCIEGDPSDALAHRDDGWIQVVCRGKQQIYDSTIQLPCVGMHPDVMTPTMPGYYGIKDSHRNARLVVEADKDVQAFQDKWIKTAKVPGLINGDTAFGNCVTSKFFQGFKIEQKKRYEKTFEVLTQIGKDFEKTFGRPGLELVEKINWPADNKVDLAIVSMGPDMGTLESMIVEESKRTGLKIGALSVRLLSPFPYFEYTRLLENAGAIAVVNQAHHQSRGHLTLDIADAISGLKTKPVLSSFFTGLGGANVSPNTWKKLIDEAKSDLVKGACQQPYRFVHEGSVL
jgi:pyruvate ferredoxin oxidoreductase alpha subunit